VNLEWGNPQLGRQIQVGRLKLAVFNQYIATFQKWCKIGTFSVKVGYALYRMVLFQMTLNYRKNPKPTVLLRDAMLARYMLSSCVCLSVCHKPALYQNG